MVEMRGIHFPPKAYFVRVLFCHYITSPLVFLATHLGTVCTTENKWRVCLVFQQPLTSACLLISIMKLRGRKRGGGK